MKKDLIEKAIVRAGFSNAKVTELHQSDLLEVMYNLIDVTKLELDLNGAGKAKQTVISNCYQPTVDNTKNPPRK